MFFVLDLHQWYLSLPVELRQNLEQILPVESHLGFMDRQIDRRILTCVNNFGNWICADVLQNVTLVASFQYDFRGLKKLF
jgi:hypothetical protein